LDGRASRFFHFDGRGLLADARKARGRLAGDQERQGSPDGTGGASAGSGESHLADKGNANRSSTLMKKLVAEFECERATPHDLRRSALTTITRLGFGRDAMDRIANHRKGGVTDVYDATATKPRTGGSWPPSPATSFLW
jgi:hypothetical protein